MRTITAKYAGVCVYCGKNIPKGATVVWERGSGIWHSACGPTGVNPEADRQYMLGRADVEEWRLNKLIYGDEAAEAIQIEKEIREGWDY